MPDESQTPGTGDQDGQAAESRWAKPGCVTIRCRRDGPLVIELPTGGEALVRVIDHEGDEFPLPSGKWAVALCRCGHSATRPFCDGSHRGIEFRAAERARPGSESGPDS